MRKRYITPEVAAHFIDVFRQTPVQIWPASCDFITDDFNNRLQSIAPLKLKTLTSKMKKWQYQKFKKKLQESWEEIEKNKTNNSSGHFKEQLKIYNNSIKRARTLYFSNLITENKNNPKFLFKTITLIINKDFNKSSVPLSNAACEDFADHFTNKVSATRSKLLSLHDVNLNGSPALLLPEETLESFVLVDAKMLGRVFPQVNPTTCLLDPIPTSF